MCLESSEQRPDGAVTFTTTGQISRVSACSEAELFIGSSQAVQAAEGALEGAEGQGAWQNDAEEEEAFLEAVTRQQQPQHPSDLLLKCRWAGASNWACWHVLREGTSCTTGTQPPMLVPPHFTHCSCVQHVEAAADGASSLSCVSRPVGN